MHNIKNMGRARWFVNYNIAIAIGKEVVLAKDQISLKENGESLNLDFSWCQTIFRRIGFTRRQVTTGK